MSGPICRTALGRPLTRVSKSTHFNPTAGFQLSCQTFPFKHPQTGGGGAVRHAYPMEGTTMPSVILRIAALAPRIAAAAGDGWGEVATAALPSDAALLALARQMCQDPGPPGRNR